MASTKFTYSPASGNGNTNVSVTTSTTNTGTTDNNATLTFTDGNTSKSVSVKQLYRPYAVYPSDTIPASGGSLSFTPHTEYPVVFQNKPSWITIKRGDAEVSAGDVIPASTASGATFSFVAGINTGSTRQDVQNFVMAHLINDTVQSYVKHIPIIQNGGATPTEMDVAVTVHFDGTVPRAGFTIQVTITSYSDYTDDYTFSLNTIYTSETENIHIKLNPGGLTNVITEVVVNQSQGTPAAGLKSNITHTYMDETEVDQAVTIGDTSTFYNTGWASTMDIGVEITF